MNEEASARQSGAVAIRRTSLPPSSLPDSGAVTLDWPFHRERNDQSEGTVEIAGGILLAVVVLVLLLKWGRAVFPRM
jgi:hypothetical protein